VTAAASGPTSAGASAELLDSLASRTTDPQLSAAVALTRLLAGGAPQVEAVGSAAAMLDDDDREQADDERDANPDRWPGLVAALLFSEGFEEDHVL
jgi:hypothetical protein